jgi:hypothetical protein
VSAAFFPYPHPTFRSRELSRRSEPRPQTRAANGAPETEAELQGGCVLPAVLNVADPSLKVIDPSLQFVSPDLGLLGPIVRRVGALLRSRCLVSRFLVRTGCEEHAGRNRKACSRHSQPTPSPSRSRCRPYPGSPRRTGAAPAALAAAQFANAPPAELDNACGREGAALERPPPWQCLMPVLLSRWQPSRSVPPLWAEALAGTTVSKAATMMSDFMASPEVAA